MIEIAIALVVSGIFLLIIGIFFARKYTLRAKLVTAFMVIVLTSLSVLAFLNSYMMKSYLTKNANQYLSTTARNYAQRIDRFYRESERFLVEESSLPSFNFFITRRADPPYTQQALLEIMRALQSRQGGNIISYAILNVDGINMVDTVSSNIGKDESNSIYFKELAKATNNKSYHSPILFERKKQIIVFSSNIIDLSGKRLGVLRAKYDAAIISQLFERTNAIVGLGSFVLLLDENNLRLVHGRRKNLQYTLASDLDKSKLSTLKKQHFLPRHVATNFTESADWNKRIQQATYSDPIVELVFYGLGESIFSSAIIKLETMPWTIITAQLQDAFLAPVEEQTEIALLMVILIVFLVVIIVMGTTHLLLGPVNRLTSVVLTIKNGSFNTKAVVEANDEIGDLAGAFNEMSENVKKLISDLEQEVGKHKLTLANLNKLSQAIEQSPISVMITDLQGMIEYVNPQLCASTGYSMEELIGKNSDILKSEQSPEEKYNNMWHEIKAGNSWSGEIITRKKDGSFFWENLTISPIKNDIEASTHYLAIKEDISLRKDYETRLVFQANYDKLTHLPNRNFALEKVSEAISDAEKNQYKLAAIYMDFDHFKNINDTLGHNIGDQFLCYMSERIKKLILHEESGNDFIARLGGDEFFVMLTNKDNKQTNFEAYIKTKIEKLLEVIAEPCLLEEMEFSTTVSAGIAIYPNDGHDAHVLLRNADTAMYRAKRKGRNGYQIFTTEMGDKLLKRVEIDNKLRRALDNNNFYLLYQPLMDVATKTIIGVEALLRWRDDELAEISPEEFIPLAEESGLIIDIGNWVLNQAFSDIKKLRESIEYEKFYVAINISGRQFTNKNIVSTMAAYLKKYDLPGESVELEITERLLLKDSPNVINVLQQFKAMNIGLSIDDFGTGYSSLSYLRYYPFDVLKIDKTFIDDINKSKNEAVICDAIISMANSLGLKVIAEGVETKKQYKYLSNKKVQTIQGYFISKPLSYSELLKYIAISEWLETTN